MMFWEIKPFLPTEVSLSGESYMCTQLLEVFFTSLLPGYNIFCKAYSLLSNTWVILSAIGQSQLSLVELSLNFLSPGGKTDLRVLKAPVWHLKGYLYTACVFVYSCGTVRATFMPWACTSIFIRLVLILCKFWATYSFNFIISWKRCLLENRVRRPFQPSSFHLKLVRIDCFCNSKNCFVTCTGMLCNEKHLFHCFPGDCMILL